MLAEENRMMQRSLLVAFAHPDDEAFGTGGTLARYAGEGVRMSLVCATRGEVGGIAHPSLATPETLGQVREAELRNVFQRASDSSRRIHSMAWRQPNETTIHV